MATTTSRRRPGRPALPADQRRRSLNLTIAAGSAEALGAVAKRLKSNRSRSAEIGVLLLDTITRRPDWRHLVAAADGSPARAALALIRPL
jgi:hypothetical protein